MRDILRNLNIMPRWVILTLDLFILLFGYIFATLVRFNFVLKDADRWLDLRRLSVYVGVYFLCSLYFKPHTSIIRYTHKEDLLAVLKTILVAGLILAGFNFYVKVYHPPRYIIPFSILIVGSLMNAALLTGYRFAVKEFFQSAVSRLGNKVRVVIFGAGETGRVAGRIMQDRHSHYALKFFLDDDPKLVGSKIQGVQVFRPDDDLGKLIRKTEIDEVIIAVQKLSRERRSWIVNECLNLGVHVKEVPDANKWVGGHLSEKQFKEIRIEDLLGRTPINIASSNAVDAFSGKVAMVTGAAGSIGSEISRQLVRCGAKKLILVDKAESDLYNLHESLKYEYAETDHVEIRICDITRSDVARELMVTYEPNILFHAAAYKHVPMVENQPLEGIRTNVLGTKTLADLAVEFSVEKFIMVSTDKAVNPTNIMGATKRSAEMYCQSLSDQSDVEFITTRFGNVLGSNGSVIPLITNQIRKGGPITITHPEITRYFMTIPEACSLVLEAGAMGKGGEIFVFDMGEPVKILDLAHKMVKLAGLEVGQDIEMKFIGLRPGEKLYEEVLSDLEGLKDTHHPKIRIAAKVPTDHEHIELLLLAIQESVSQRDEMKAVKNLKHLVPEFKSQMSRFEVLDKVSKS